MSDDQTGAQGDGNKPDDTQGGDTSNKGTEGASGAQGSGNDTKNDAPEGTVSLADYEAVKARMQAADKAKSDAEKKLADLEKKDMSELDRTKTELAERDKTIETLNTTIANMALQNAFLTDNKYTWHDPRDALALLDREGVEIKEDGKVTGLRQAIDKLAKAKPHLIKGDEKKNDGEGEGEPSGSASNGRRKGDEKSNKVDYSRRFPALKR